MAVGALNFAERMAKNHNPTNHPRLPDGGAFILKRIISRR